MATIYHISDIHINSNNPLSPDYKEYFDLLIESITTNKNKDLKNNKIILAILGDVFHYNVKYTSKDVALFNYLITRASEVCDKILICLGNHDCESRATNRDEDLISPLLGVLFKRNRGGEKCSGWDKVVFLRKSCELEVFGVKFAYISVFEERMPEFLEFAKKDTILLYHGGIYDASHDRNQSLQQSIALEEASKFKAVLLGDWHTHRYIADNIAYSGSLVQTKISDGLSKGYIKWEISPANEIKSQFYNLRFTKGHITLTISEESSIKEQVEKMGYTPPQLIGKYLIKTENMDLVESEINAIYELLPDIDIPNRRIIKTAKQEKHEIKPVVMRDFVKEVIAQIEEIYTEDNKELTDKFIAQLKALSITSNIWRVEYLQFANLFRYRNINAIDFTTMRGINGIISKNDVGKSSILDIIQLAIYGRCVKANDVSRTNNKSNEIIHSNKQYGYTKIAINLGNSKLLIYRRFGRCAIPYPQKADFKVQVAVYEDKGAGYLPIQHTAKVKDLNEWIESKLGTYNNFMSINMYYNDSIDIIQKASFNGSREFIELFNIPNLTDLNKYWKARRLELQDEVKRLQFQADINKKAIEEETAIMQKNELDFDTLLTKIDNRLITKRADLAVLENSLLDEKLARAEKIVSKYDGIAEPIKNPEFNNLRGNSADYDIESIQAEINAMPEDIENITIKDIEETECFYLYMKKYNEVEEKLAKLEKYNLKHSFKDRLKRSFKDNFIKIIDELNTIKESNLRFNKDCAECAKNRLIVGFAGSKEEAEIANQVKGLLYELMKLEYKDKAIDVPYEKLAELRRLINRRRELVSKKEIYALLKAREKYIEEKDKYDKYIKAKNLIEKYKDKSGDTKTTLSLSKEALIAEIGDLEAKKVKVLQKQTTYLNAKKKVEELMQFSNQKQTNEAELKIAVIKRLEESISKDNIDKIIEDTVKQFVSRINGILHDIGIDKVIDFVATKDTGNYRFIVDGKNLSMSGNFVKTLVSIMMRIMFMQTTSAPRMLFIDEGLGCVDGDNFERMIPLLKMQEFVFVSSYKKKFLDALNRNIELIINKEYTMIDGDDYIEHSPDKDNIKFLNLERTINKIETTTKQNIVNSSKSYEELCKERNINLMDISTFEEYFTEAKPGYYKCSICGDLRKDRMRHFKSAKHKAAFIKKFG